MTTKQLPWLDPGAGNQADPDPDAAEVAALGKTLADLRPTLTKAEDAHVEEILHPS